MSEATIAGTASSADAPGDGVTVGQSAMDAHSDAEPATIARRFAIWGTIATFAITFVTVLVSLARTHGHLAYAIDDGGIHLSVARNLALHGTWGVVPHEFQSASTSALWTVLLAPFARVLPRSAFEYMPLVLASIAAAGYLVILGREQTVLGTRRWSIVQMAAVVALSAGVLFLTGLAMTGMEHVLHIALVTLTVALFAQADRAGRAPSKWAYIALALAAFTRYETLFVAAGLGAAQLVRVALDHPRERPAWWTAIRRAIAIGACAAGPVVVLGAFNIAMGQQFFPNSVIAKSALGGGANEKTISFLGGLTAIATDPLVLFFFVTALCYLAAAFATRARRAVVPATVVVVAVVAHSYLASYGWFERYQAYLIALGVFFAFGAVTEAMQRAPVTDWPRWSAAAAALVILLAFFLGPTKWNNLWHTPMATQDTYVQRYQAGLFLEHYYHAQPVATGELGYISYFHEGKLTDFFGLGDHEVLEAREQHRQSAAYWEQLIRERGVHVVAVYPLTLWNETPKSWTLVGEWKLDIKNATAFEDVLQFWAPNKSDVEPLFRQLVEWDGRLPEGTHTEMNPFLPYKSNLRTFPCC